MEDMITDETSWVDVIVAKMQGATNGILQAQIGGQTVQAYLGKEAILFFTQNKILLENVGIDAFRDFLLLISQNKRDEAFQVLLQKMDADAIIARLNMDADELQHFNDDHDAFIKSLENFALQVLEGAASSAASKILLALL